MILTDTSIKHFDASTVALTGSNLIEASAGTGKTYSIAIMVLRLVLENNIPIKEILMVTFTKAAVAELEERIRLFIRQAYKVSLEEETGDPTIIKLVNEAIDKNGLKEVQQLLREAVLFLDETSVLTIHSFCQQALTEFAFETNQVFGSDTLDNVHALIESEVNKFWRQHITTMNLHLLTELLTYGLERAKLVSVIKEHVTGKRYFEYDENESYSLCDEDQVNFSRQINELADKNKELVACLLERISKDAARLKIATENNRYAKKELSEYLATPKEFLAQVLSRKKSQYIKTVYPDILEEHDGCHKLLEDKDHILQSIINKIYCHAIGVVSKAIDSHKQRNSLLSFDDMIVHLHKAVVHDSNENLISALRKKYRAVFVDEFQDTDKLQYEIFHTTYDNPENILFYIGDPKQSIYAWRKADIFTYFKASDEVANKYSMNVNFRSSARYIRGMNLFFKPNPGFDTFHFEKFEKSIDYIKVDSPADNKKGELFFDDEPDTPFTVYENKNNTEVAETVIAQVIQLLEDERYKIIRNGVGRRVKPSDIGILVRKNEQAMSIKTCLAQRGIPAVTIDETKILESKEASYVLYLLEALIDTNRSTINKALLTPFTDYTPERLLVTHEEAVLNRFKDYKAIWEKDGVYSLLMKFIADYNVRSVLLNRHSENGERTISNLYQIIEILHKAQSEKQLSALEVISWLKRGIDGMEIEGDEFEQRVESDEESVKIVTIHKSKGLEYNIVFAPFLDLNTEPAFDFCSFRDPHTGDYIFLDKTQLTGEQKDLLTEQTEQENRRLIYVAISRAVYKSYINRSSSSRGLSLIPFVSALQMVNSPLVSFTDPPAIPQQYVYSKAPSYTPAKEAKVVSFQLQQLNWRKISYTSLAAQHATTAKKITGKYVSAYDHFVFKQLSRGNKTGNLLHYIFENIDFTNEQYWEYTIKNAIKRFMPKAGKEYAPMLLQLLQTVIKADIAVPGQHIRLSGITSDKRLNEFEFDFNVPVFNPADLATLEEGRNRIHVRYSSQVEGLMNGKMDMFFEHQGRYYILDWKSNFLGDSADDYRREVLPDAMSENNYHFQYLIYTLAAIKFLRVRFPGFDYEAHFGGVIYLFVRGIRPGSDGGIFIYKPMLQTIQRLEEML